MNFRLTIRRARGVTLVELVVVIAVAGILAAVSAPTIFGAMRRERQRQVANDVANQFREARNQAMSRGHIVIMRTTVADQKLGTYIPRSLDGNLIRSCRQSAADGGYSTGANEPVSSYELSFRNSANMEIKRMSSNAINVCFSPDGSIGSMFSGFPTPPSTPTACEGERFLIYLGDKDATTAAYNSSAGCNNKASEYESVGAYVVRIGQNGEIGLRSPKDG